MQADPITLSVDELNDGSTVNHQYDRYLEGENRTVYNGPGHAIDAINQMTLYRTEPKPSGESRGKAKSAIKLSENVAVDNRSGDGQIVDLAIAETSFKIPVGVTAAWSLKFRQKMVAALDHALATALVDNLSI